MSTTIWQNCLEELRGSMRPQDFSTWIRPLHAEQTDRSLILLAPNQIVLKTISDQFLEPIQDLVFRLMGGNTLDIILKVGTAGTQIPAPISSNTNNSTPGAGDTKLWGNSTDLQFAKYSKLNPAFTFETFVEGDSNRIAKAAAWQIANAPGSTLSYNPLFLYGDVGLGKTHLMQAVGNAVLARAPETVVLYVHSERFVADMIKALQRNAMEDFKRFYRSVNLLLIDDIQFFAGKERSQEEFFHTFNALLDTEQQIIITSDRYPKELDGLEERLKSRFGWGLTAGVTSPELETRVAILKNKAELSNINLPDEVAFFIAKRIKSNVRELEGALKRVIANAHFMGRAITLEFAKEALKDLLLVQAKLISIDNIQKTVAKYFKVKVADLVSKSRSRSITRPRQIAMTLAKELTNYSLPEIGDAFGGRDHTTVLHAHRKIKGLLLSNIDVKEDFENLMRTLSS